jgi:8-oxo-dGTP diphosphatase
MTIHRQPPHVYSATAFRRPQVAVEVAVFVVSEGHLGLILVPVDEFSSTPRWGLPAAVIEEQPSLDEALDDVIRPLLGDSVTSKHQVQTFDRLSDSRGRLIEIAWLAAAPTGGLAEAAAQHTIGYGLASDGDTLELTDQSGTTLEMPAEQTETALAAIDRLRELLDTECIAFGFLADEFTLRDLHAAHEAVLGQSLNYDSFRRRMLTSGLIEPSGQVEQNVKHRPAELYRVRPSS